jgi:predicted Zn-dependent protease
MISEKRYGEAVPLLAESVRIGKATSAEISFLATAQRLSGDLNGAEQTLAAAVDLYPRSTFVLTRYASILRENGKTVQSDEVLSRAFDINRKTTNTWWAFINDGPRAASERAFANSDQYVQVMDLLPRASIYALKAERDILHPEDRVQYDFGNRGR